MTTQTAYIQTFDYGSSLGSPTIRHETTDASQSVTGITCNELTADSGLYAFVVTNVSVLTGGFRIRCVVNGQPINRYVTFAGVDGEVVFSRTERAAELDSAATAALVDLIWDEPLTGATHNVATSSGKRLRQATAFQQIDSTVVDASATTTTFVTGLTSAVDDFYNDSMLVFTDGALAGQVRAISDYVGATKTIILEEALTSAPVNGVAFTIVSLHIHPVSQIQSGLATSAALAAAKTILDKVDTGLVVDGAVYQFTANMLELGPSGGGGGDATLAKQTEILAAIQGSEVIQVASPNVSGNLVLTQGDDYDGVANPKASWTVTTDYTSGWTVRLTIRSATDAVIYTATGTVVSSTVVAVTIAAPTGLTMTGCPGQWQGKFDVELTHSSGKKKTIALGTCYINEDQTR
jgi:hypothetical protein